MGRRENRIEEIARRRGIFWLASDVYGGISGLYDYGHVGALIKRRWEGIWRKYFLSMSDNFFELDCRNIMPSNVLKASGHVESFVDPIAKCRKCGSLERADHLVQSVLHESFEGLQEKDLTALVKKHNIKCPKCGGDLEDVGVLNMMFPVMAGASPAYLRPETAQGAYVSFPREFEVLRKKLPLGLAIIGRAYRNEISPRNLLIRMREFDQAELQIFFNPEKISEHESFEKITSYKLRLLSVSSRKSGIVHEISCSDISGKLPKFYVYYMAMIQKFYIDCLGVSADKFRFKELSDEEKAFYNKYHWDIELRIESMEGFVEVGGIHYRTDHDLAGHQKVSGHDMSVFHDGKKFIPHVLELSFGVDRNVYAMLDLAYSEETINNEERVIFRLPRNLSPFDCAVFPLVNRDGMDKTAGEIKEELVSQGISVFYDDSGSVGRRYRRMDEIGVAACITIDSDTPKDSTVTLRDRDTMKQVRISRKDLAEKIKEFLSGKDVENLGELLCKGE
ncbi:MAG: glycine--tRNA ligase [Candidatus Aenigmarchaeota archaeon]|nr:glycine--tRNA ligase [Candidatus Aenigmarchaeota archaeon]MDI6722148.1 glycine--tRNA ligase [Candidatus Aenigmarchaeota archaeon]